MPNYVPYDPSTTTTDYSHVTQEMFDAELRRQVSEIASTELLDIPGVYEIVAEHFHNDVLSAFDEDGEAITNA